MSFDLAALNSAIENDGMVVRVVIAAFQGSSPRETGASMLVSTKQSMGTIGGGALEFRAIKQARQMIDRCTKHQIETIPLGPNLGQCCGGTVTLVSELYSANTTPKFGAFFARPLSAKTKEPIWITQLYKRARNSGYVPKITLKDGWLIEPFMPPLKPVWIYGAGHVGRALVDAFQGLDFDITWIDTHQNRFPNFIPSTVTHLTAQDPTQLVKYAPINACHYVLTYSHELDLALCHAILRHGCDDLGLIGSKTKFSRFKSRLQKLGHTHNTISQITCPIGDPSLGKHPKAIAVGTIHALLIKNNALDFRKEAVS